MKSPLVALSLILATLSAPALALGVPNTHLTPSLTFPDQPTGQVSKDKTTIRK